MEPGAGVVRWSGAGPEPAAARAPAERRRIRKLESGRRSAGASSRWGLKTSHRPWDPLEAGGLRAGAPRIGAATERGDRGREHPGGACCTSGASENLPAQAGAPPTWGEEEGTPTTLGGGVNSSLRSGQLAEAPPGTGEPRYWNTGPQERPESTEKTPEHL
ncbi:hypothetical protein NDU88_005473 [Pleurodeles waltl]|uniref:Uncharacterized protein n=1 Tax=Pleurodeles waltl TaxID=8319 RepID=A0AAV7WCT7_PLEWA|nr:hypothetical protein NDU88_005473 [Pleurodeles waltl]